jgi:hypothetical protein
VSWDVVVAVDIGTWDLLEGWMEGPAVQTRSSAGLEGLLTGDRYADLRRAINRRGDRGAACRNEPESEGEHPATTAGFYRADGWGREGYPIGRSEKEEEQEIQKR